jgi:hypothetical protein
MSALYLKHPKETDLALFAGGEAGPFSRWRIERHLETCPQCEQAVADFFHLADELSVLGDTPDIDWNAMSADIQARLAVESPEPAQRRAVPAWTWQLGAAAACALVVAAVLQVGPKAEPDYAPRAEQALAEKDVAAQESAAGPADEIRANNEPAPQPSQLQRQLERADAEPQARDMFAAEAKKEAPEAEAVMLADLAKSELSTDAAAPPPPVANKVSAQSAPAAAPAEADAILLAGERRARAAGPIGGGLPATLGATAGFRAEPFAYSVEPLQPAGADVRVGADGWISVRAVQADGSMTITEVYEPQ